MSCCLGVGEKETSRNKQNENEHFLANKLSVTFPLPSFLSSKALQAHSFFLLPRDPQKKPIPLKIRSKAKDL